MHGSCVPQGISSDFIWLVLYHNSKAQYIVFYGNENKVLKFNIENSPWWVVYYEWPYDYLGRKGTGIEFLDSTRCID